MQEDSAPVLQAEENPLQLQEDADPPQQPEPNNRPHLRFELGKNNHPFFSLPDGVPFVLTKCVDCM